MDRFERYDASRFLGSPREPLVSPEYVWRSALAARLAGIREPGRGLSLCAVGWSRATQRSGMASGRLRHAAGKRTRLSMGRRPAGRESRQFRFAEMGPDTDGG